jgi:GNAT superfamily N-acetyltransferase
MGPEMPTNRKGSAEEAKLPTTITIEKIESAEVIASAKAIVNDEWGGFYGDKFEQEALQIMRQAPSIIHGYYLPSGQLVGVGCLLRAGFDYAYWSLTWIMVDKAHRGLGIGKAIVDSLLDYARDEQAKCHNPNCRVLLTTTKPEFYSKNWNFKTITEGPLAGEHLMMLDVVGPGLEIRS